MANPFSQRGLTFKQVVLTLLVTLLVGGGVTALQSWRSLGAERADAEQRMALLLAAARENAAAAAYRLDTDLAAYVATGLASSSVIAQARIVDERGDLLASSTDAADGTAPAWLIELAYGGLEPMAAPLFGLTRPDLKVGTITIEPDREALATEFLDQLMDLVLLDLAKAVVLALVLSVMFFYALTEPLLRLVGAVRRVSPGRDVALEDVQILRARDDEFARLVRTFDHQLLLFRELLEERGDLLDDLRLRNAAIASMDSGIAIVDSTRADHPIVDANAAMATLLDVTIDELAGQNLLVFLERARRSDAAYTELEAFIRKGLSGGAVSGVFELYGRDGAPLWGKISIVPAPDEQDRITHRVIIINDITEARETEEKLRHSQKMDALGRVAGGIAHDFNNMLAIMKGNLEITRMDFESHPEFLEALEPIDHSVDRAAELTRRLLRFSRTTPIEAHTVCVDESITQMKEMLRSSLTPEIGIELELAAPDARVRIDKGDLEDALLNLAVNARDAMPEGGRLELRTSEAALTANSNELKGDMKAGRYLRLSVTDTGAGMDEATRKRVFEPFYTTKSEFDGTGLGLSQVYGFVERSGGSIDVASRPGSGTTFTILLPVRNAPPLGAPDTESTARTPGGDETILLVDDEPDLLRAASRLLERLGYTVVSTTEPADALERFEASPESFDMLLSDVVMPGGMNGHELADALRPVVPDLPVLLVSGYDSRRARGESTYPLLAKPYSSVALAREIRSLLDQAAATGDRRS